MHWKKKKKKKNPSKKKLMGTSLTNFTCIFQYRCRFCFFGLIALHINLIGLDWIGFKKEYQ